MHLRSILTKKPRALNPSDTLTYALNALAQSGRRQLPVIADGVLVGIVSEWDLLRAWTRGNPDLIVARLMTSNVHTASPSEEVASVAQRMVDERVGCLPVLDKDRFLGLVDIGEVARALARPPARKRPRTKA